MEIVVGIGECIISNRQDDILKTFGLGSCLALMIYAPRKKVLGLAHIALPYAFNPEQDFLRQPGRYVDTAVPFLIKEMAFKYRCTKKELIVNLYGGAESSREQDLYQIGARNIRAMKSILAANNIVTMEEDLGGIYTRSLEVDVATGTVKLIKI